MDSFNELYELAKKSIKNTRLKDRIIFSAKYYKNFIIFGMEDSNLVIEINIDTKEVRFEDALAYVLDDEYMNAEIIYVDEYLRKRA